MEDDQLSLDIGFDSLIELAGRKKHPKFPFSSYVPAIIDFLEQYPTIEFIPYNGVASMLSGGRRDTADMKDIEESFLGLNRAGYSFNIVFNGGNQFPDNIIFEKRTFPEETKILESLAESGARNGVVNYVTIFRNELNRFVKTEFPHLKTLASCIRYIVPGTGSGIERYQRDTEEFDYVVPANTHTDPDFLSDLDPKKLVLFYNLFCANKNPERCTNHYLNEMLSIMHDLFPYYDKDEREEEEGKDKEEDDDDDREDEEKIIKVIGWDDQREKTYIPSKIEFKPTSIPNNMRCGYNTLEDRIDDCKSFISSGVNKFKIPRSTGFSNIQLYNLSRRYEKFRAER